MKVNEYVVINDDNHHPSLMKKSVINYDYDFNYYDDIIKFLNGNFLMNKLSEEYVYILSFNNNNQLLGVFQLSHGKSESTPIGMRELGIFLLLTGAEYFYIAHNHPNGNSNPSIDDIHITNRIEDLSKTIDVKLMQHFVIAGDTFDTVIDKCDDDFFKNDTDEDWLPFQI